MFITVENLKLDTKEEWQSLSYILDAFKERNHLVWISKESLQETLKNQKFLDHIGHEREAVVERLLEIGDECEQIHEYVNCYLNIDFMEEDRHIVSISEENNIFKYTISYKKIMDAKILQETKLYAENDVDCEIYKELGRVFLERNSMQERLFIQADCVAGGGSTTASFIEMEIKKDKETPILCIVDADITCPEEEIPQDKTAKKVLDICHKYKEKKMLHVHVLDSKYIENLIPEYISKHIFRKDLGLAHLIENEKYRLYIDKKKETTLACIRALAPDSEVGLFWKVFLEKYEDYPDKTVVSIKIHAKDRLTHYLDNILKPEIRDQLVEDESSMWNKVAKHVFSWCLSHNLYTA